VECTRPYDWGKDLSLIIEALLKEEARLQDLPQQRDNLARIGFRLDVCRRVEQRNIDRDYNTYAPLRAARVYTCATALSAMMGALREALLAYEFGPREAHSVNEAFVAALALARVVNDLRAATHDLENHHLDCARLAHLLDRYADRIDFSDLVESSLVTAALQRHAGAVGESEMLEKMRQFETSLSA
jgi:hypothetical protein